MTSSNFLFGITRPTNITFVQSSLKFVGQERVLGRVEVREIGDDREHAGRAEAERLELLAVVFGVAERQVAAIDVRRQFAAAAEAELDQLFVDPDEVLGGVMLW